MADEAVTLLITPKIWSKIFAYAQLAEGEISGFGSLNKRNVIDSLFPLLEQECGYADTEMTEDAIQGFIESGNSQRARVWWHSHVDMGVFWSPTDENNIETLGRFYDYIISIVVNKRREIKTRLDIFRPVRIKFLDANLRLSVPALADQELEKMKTEIAEKVTKPKSYAIRDVSDRKEGRIEIIADTRADAYGRALGRLPSHGPITQKDLPKWMIEEGWEVEDGKLVFRTYNHAQLTSRRLPDEKDDSLFNGA